MIKKKVIIGVLVDYGLSIIEADRVLDSKKDFELAIEDLLDKAVSEEWQPKQKRNIK